MQRRFYAFVPVVGLLVDVTTLRDDETADVKQGKCLCLDAEKLPDLSEGAGRESHGWTEV